MNQPSRPTPERHDPSVLEKTPTEVTEELAEAGLTSQLTDQDWIDEMIARWEELAEDGADPCLDELCRRRPHLREQVERQVAKLQRFNRRLGSPGRSAKNPLTPGQSLSYRTELDEVDLFNNEGGLGVIYSARDRLLQRVVAVKVSRRPSEQANEGTDAARALGQFHEESMITGLLDHPGIVAVHGIGETEQGCPFYVMKLIRGQTLQEAIAEHHARSSGSGRGHSSLRWRSGEFRLLLRHLIAACETIAYAHDAGVVHRDIKPSNIMLGRYRETFVLDWGLATPHDDPVSQEITHSDLRELLGSRDHSTAGTLIYMAPERLSHPENPPMPAQDIYSLGGTLYKLLTGRSPFEERLPRSGVIHRLLNDRIESPRKWEPSLPKPLEAICLKALAFAPEDRYERAQDLAGDLERYLDDEAVTAVPESVWQRGERFIRRHSSAMIIAAIAVVIGFLLVVGGLGVLAQSAERQRDAKVQAEKLTARFAALTTGQKIDNRWRILELTARDTELIKLLEAWDAPWPPPGEPIPRAQWRNLNSRLIELGLEYRDVLPTDSWFLCDAKGNQVARISGDYGEDRVPSLGQNYAHRDYFHGLGEDFDPDTLREPPAPISDFHLSTPYFSTNDQMLKVALSVPIFAHSETRSEVIGVVGMALKLGESAFLRGQSESSLITILAQLDPDQVEGEPRTGLILQHPELREEAEDRNSQEPPTIARLSAEQVEQLNAIRDRFADKDTRPSERQAVSFESFADPVPTSRGQSVRNAPAAVMPVFIEGRRSPRTSAANGYDLGWVIIVQERSP